MTADTDAAPTAAAHAGGDQPQHGGLLAHAAARRHGVATQWTLSGAHVFPMYDAAVKGPDPVPLMDVRHEQTAVFAAEAEARLERRPGLAVLTAGPGVTNGVSGVTSAHFNGVPLLVVGGRAPAGRWGQGALQELDHPPLLAPVTKSARTAHDTAGIATAVDESLTLARSPRRGPTFVDVPMDVFFGTAPSPLPEGPADAPAARTGGDLDGLVAALSRAERPVLVLGGDVWLGGAEVQARRLVEGLGVPAVPQGQGRGVVPSSSPLCVVDARGQALGQADLVVVVGTPLDFRLGFGAFGGRDGAAPAAVAHVVDDPDSLAGHVELAASAAGDLGEVLDALHERVASAGHPDWTSWTERLAEAGAAKARQDAELLATGGSPVHPARVYGALREVLDDDAVVIGDGGDFVSYAGKHVRAERPGCWLDPGPYGCLGTGLGYAMAARVARPSSQVCLLLGDGAAGFSLMDVDSAVRQRLPFVAVVGNNGVWGLEKGPMQTLYGYDVAADLNQQARYDTVVEALGGAGETVADPADLVPALRRAFAADVPYLVNVLTDPAAAYPRQTTGV